MYTEIFNIVSLREPIGYVELLEEYSKQQDQTINEYTFKEAINTIEQLILEEKILAKETSGLEKLYVNKNFNKTKIRQATIEEEFDDIEELSLEDIQLAQNNHLPAIATTPVPACTKTNLSKLIEHDYLSATELHPRGRRLYGKEKAYLNQNGTMRLGGKVYDSATQAAKDLCEKYNEPSLSVSGWEFWAVKQENMLIPLSEFRDSFVNKIKEIENHATEEEQKRLNKLLEFEEQ